MYATIVRESKLFHAGVIPNMLIDNQFMKCVTFLFIDRQIQNSRNTERIPAATAFFVSVPIGDDIEQIYAVTARHVIDSSREYGNLYLRLRLERNLFQDIMVPQDNWVCHPQTDVAVIPVELLDEAEVKIIPLEMLITEQKVASDGVGIGDDVFFVGLFSEYSGKKHDRPIVRFGNISLMHEELPLKLTPGSDATTLADAYLVEARSWGGHSGSPAFIYYALDREPGVINFGGPRFVLLGLTHGHYEIKKDVAFIGDILGSGKVPVNAGIAVVIPAQKIIDTLMQEELLEERRRDLIEHQKQAKTPRPDIGFDEKTITKQQFHDLGETRLQNGPR